MITQDEIMNLLKEAFKISLVLLIVKEVVSIDREVDVERIRQIIREETQKALQYGALSPSEAQTL